MKKWQKITLIVIGTIIIAIILDIVSIYTRNKPIFAIKDDIDCSSNVYRGLLYDTYDCMEYSVPQIVTKWADYSCITEENEMIIGKIKDIKDNYIIITGTSDNIYLKHNDEAHITLSNNPSIKGANNLIIGQFVKIRPTNVQETYPIVVTTDEIEIISGS